MHDRDSVFNDLNVAKLILCNQQMLTPEMCIRIGQAITSALAMMKEQDAVVPGIAQDVDGIFAMCGNCKKKLWKMMGLEFVVNPDEMPRFCPRCGKEVKWE